MELDELKASWRVYDEKISRQQQLNEQMFLSMIKDRSKSNLAKMGQKIRLAGTIMVGTILFFTAAILGNPFDFTNWYSYVPMVLYLVLGLFALVIIVKEHRQLNQVNLSRENLRDSLAKVIQSHEQTQRILGKVWLLFMVAGFLLGVALVSRNFDAYGMAKTVTFLGLQVGIILVLYGLAKWVFRAFEDPQAEALKESLKELDQLKQLL
ncbi:hypothetical protein [Tellurirhabdus bombi]|uniref:hypothetical protein n=1 Tax=Tellurirhabdus bombi TaxID=2907205 RepID=UPI001F2DBAF9|nr:hypothetical protein [Tellurirhabdus bombi]